MEVKVAITMPVSPLTIASALALLDVLDGNDWYDDMEHVEAIEHLLERFVDMGLSPEAKEDALAALDAIQRIGHRKETPWASQ